MLKKPRRVMMLVKAGKPVDDFIELVIPFLEAVSWPSHFTCHSQHNETGQHNTIRPSVTS